MVDATRSAIDACGLDAEVAELRLRLDADSASRDQAARTGRIIERFAQFAATGCGIGSLADVSSEVASRFLRATCGDGTPPSVSTMHWRRTSLRLLFRAGRDAGLVAGDPTLDLALPARSSLTARPLSDDEVALCRSVAQWSLTGTRRAAIWALAEATCRSSEIPHIRPTDLDLAAGGVRIHGGKVTDERVGQLTEWGVERLHARLAELDDPNSPITYSGRAAKGAGQVAGACGVVDVLVRAGLHGEPDVRPGSVASWAGRRILDESGRIDLAAKALGVRSLDRAAEIVAWDWRHDSDGDQT